MKVAIRKVVIEYIGTNGASTKEELEAALVSAGAEQRRIDGLVERMARRGKLIESGGTYTVAP